MASSLHIAKPTGMPPCTCLTVSAMNTASITGSRSRITGGPTEKPERMNRTLKDATVKRYHYETHDQLKRHLHTFLMAYNLPHGL